MPNPYVDGIQNGSTTIDIYDAALRNTIGQANGLASLDANGKLPSTQLPSDTTTSASGNPISISGLKSNQLAVNPIITLEPIQAGSGTPSPVNQRPISGYDKVVALCRGEFTEAIVEAGGKNLFPENYIGNYVINSAGTITANDTSIASIAYTTVKPNTVYYGSISVGSRDRNFCIFWYDANKTLISYETPNYNNKTCTSPANAKYARLFWQQSDTPAEYLKDFILCENSLSDKSYEPYYKTTDISESLGQTVYGATWYPRSGKLVVDRKEIDLANQTWLTYAGMYYINMTDSIPSQGEGHIIAERYKSQIDTTDDNIIFINWQNRLFVKCSGETPQGKAVYELATPFIIQLTPHEISLLKDYAYVSTNGTNIALDYHNGELASLSDVSQLSETVALLDRPQERKTIVNITSYNTSSNRYSCEFDGYITALIPSGTGYVRVTIYDDLSQTMGISQRYAKSDGDEYYAVFVKKGMKAMVTASSGISPTVTFRGMA